MLQKKPAPFYMGVDGGGSKTAAVVVDAAGHVLGRGVSGGANYHHHGVDAVQTHLQTAMNEAAIAAKVPVEEATAVYWGLAGISSPRDREQIEQIAKDLLPNMTVQIGHDALVALVGGLNGRRNGIVLIAGTGMIVYGENEAGQTARAGGWGYLLERGSGYSLAREGIQAWLRADEQKRATTLGTTFCEHLQLLGQRELIAWLYAPTRTVAEIATLAPLVLQAAEAGDVVAQGVALAACEALAQGVRSVYRQLGGEKRPFPLVLAGSLLTKNDFYRRLAVQAIHTYLPQAEPQLPLRDAAVGAALLAKGTNIETKEQGTQAVEAPQRLPMSEQRHFLTNRLDQLTTLDIVSLMQLQDRQAAQSVELILPKVAQAIDAIAPRLQKGGRLIYVGAGTSGRLGILDASECPPTFNTSSEQVIGLIAGGERAIQQSIEGAEDDAAAGARALQEVGLTGQDCVVGIAASGHTPYVVGALREAKQTKALSIALTCNLPAPIATIADIVLAPLVGPEALTGSTRLKAGTAQKLVLNMLSTGVMVRLGKTYGNLMVDVQTSNQKLQGRARRIVAAACEIDEVVATAVLQACGGDVKVAIVSQLANVSPKAAKRRLDNAGGVVRKALHANTM